MYGVKGVLKHPPFWNFLEQVSLDYENVHYSVVRQLSRDLLFNRLLFAKQNRAIFLIGKGITLPQLSDELPVMDVSFFNVSS